MGEAVLALLRVLWADRRAVLVLDDAHWADRDTLALLEYLAGVCTLAATIVVAVATIRRFLTPWVRCAGTPGSAGSLRWFRGGRTSALSWAAGLPGLMLLRRG